MPRTTKKKHEEQDIFNLPVFGLHPITVKGGDSKHGVDSGDTLHADFGAEPKYGDLILYKTTSRGTNEPCLALARRGRWIELATVNGKRYKNFKPMPKVLAVVRSITKAV